MNSALEWASPVQVKRRAKVKRRAANKAARITRRRNRVKRKSQHTGVARKLRSARHHHR